MHILLVHVFTTTCCCEEVSLLKPSEKEKLQYEDLSFESYQERRERTANKPQRTKKQQTESDDSDKERYKKGT